MPTFAIDYISSEAKCIVVTTICVSVCPSPHSHYCTDPNVTYGNGRGCPLVVHYLADLQAVHGFHCCDNIAPIAVSVSAATRSMPGFRFL